MRNSYLSGKVRNGAAGVAQNVIKSLGNQDDGKHKVTRSVANHQNVDVGRWVSKGRGVTQNSIRWSWTLKTW
jgi:hypothetical protein